MTEHVDVKLSSPDVKARSALVSTEWVRANLTAPKLKIVDATLFLAASGIAAKENFMHAHIPGAIFVDMEAVCDPHSNLPNTMPTAGHFGRVIGEVGISNEDFVVIYDTHGMMSAPRLWWMFRAFGHEKVAVLDGGLPKWCQENLPVASGNTQNVGQKFRALDPPQELVVVADIEKALSTNIQIVDARSTMRFEGTQAEPRPGLRCGHIPGSRNVPYTSLLEASTGTLASRSQLIARFQAAAINLAGPIICSCGSGVSACVLALALYEIGVDDVKVYDGSWTEWGGDLLRPVEIGPYRV